MQQRGQCGNPDDYFSKTWEEYKNGFEQNCEKWIGLDRLHELTSNEYYNLKVNVTYSGDGTSDGGHLFAYYNSFKVGPETDNYRLSVGKFNREYWENLGIRMLLENALGNPKDSDQPWGPTNYLELSNKRVNSGVNGAQFSTKDHDNDKWKYSCSNEDEHGFNNSMYGGLGGWWFLKCGMSNLNGLNGIVNKNEYDNSRIRWNSKWGSNMYESTKMELIPNGNVLLL